MHFVPQKVPVKDLGECGKNDVMEAALILKAALIILKAVDCPHIVKTFGCLITYVCVPILSYKAHMIS